MVPAAERPTKDDLEGYLPRFDPEPDLAWGELYPQVAAWLTDREARKAKEDREGADRSETGIGQFNYSRG